MADVAEYEYKGKRIHVSVNKSGAQYVAHIDSIDGIKVPPAMRDVTGTTEGGASRAARRRAEQIIDSQAAPPPENR